VVQDLATAPGLLTGTSQVMLQILGGTVSWYSLPADVADFAVTGVAVQRLFDRGAARVAQRRVRRADVSMQLLRLRAAARVVAVC
jgi:hypothetical protein